MTSTLEPTISEIGNNFLLNEPIIEGIIKPNDLAAADPAAANATENICPPVLHVSIVGAVEATNP